MKNSNSLSGISKNGEVSLGCSNLVLMFQVGQFYGIKYVMAQVCSNRGQVLGDFYLDNHLYILYFNQVWMVAEFLCNCLYNCTYCKFVMYLIFLKNVSLYVLLFFILYNRPQTRQPLDKTNPGHKWCLSCLGLVMSCVRYV